MSDIASRLRFWLGVRRYAAHAGSEGVGDAVVLTAVASVVFDRIAKGMPTAHVHATLLSQPLMYQFFLEGIAATLTSAGNEVHGTVDVKITEVLKEMALRQEGNDARIEEFLKRVEAREALRTKPSEGN